MSKFKGDFVLLSTKEKQIIQKRIQELKKMLRYSLIAILFFTWILPIFLRMIINANRKPDEFYIEKGQAIPEAFDLTHLIIVIASLNIIALLVTIFLIIIPLHSFKKELKKGMKIMFRLPVLRKQFMAINQTYFMHLYYHKPFTIEISGQDFQNLNEGDEVILYYTPQSAIYLGYRINI